MSPRRWGRGGVLALAALSAILVFGVPSAVAAFHGVAVAKSTVSPVKIGDPYTSSAFISNTVDTGQDTIVVTGLIDVVFASGGNVNSGNILSSVGLIFGQTGGQGTVTCVGGSGAGTALSPYVGATSCTLTFGATITTANFTHYTVVAGDFNIDPATHRLADQITWDWHNTCLSDPDHDCTTDPQHAQAGASALVQQLTTSTTTDIHNAAHGTVTVVEAGSTVHDFVTVTGQPGSPNPSGNVTLDFFTNNQCTGAPAATSAPIALTANGTVDATSFPQGPLAAGLYGFKAHYAGDATYPPSDGPCEPLRVVDANIQLTPATATNAVGTNHTLTCHINVNDGSGQVNAPDGTICTVAIISGPGTPATQNCTTTGGTGSCTVVITSAATGTSVLRASTNVTVAGLVLHRETGDAHPGDGPDAQKVWVNANIQITPATATNPVGTNHVLTITVNALNGTIDAGPHTATASIVSGPGTFVGSPSCTYTGGAATASCTVTITSNTSGTTVVSATSDIPVNGQTITRTTNTAVNTAAGGSGNAEKLWLQPDANIQLTPATATNAVGTNHTLTCHINVSPDGVTFSNAPNGTVCTVTITAGPGTPTTQNCTTSGGTGSCTVTITSATTGTTTLNASTTVAVNGVVLTRTTNGQAGNSGPAQKNWADDTVRTDVHDAAHNVITTATSGDVVHDKVFVAKAAGTPAAVPNPTGTVTFNRYNTLNCSGTAASTETVPLGADGTAESSAFTTTTTDISYQAVYSGDANYPGHTGACEPLHVEVPGGLIAPTQTTCNDVLNGTAAVLGQINYSVRGGVITQGINPGVFFYYAKITTTVPNQVVTVTQTNTSTNNARLFGILNGQAWLWSGDCSSKLIGTVINGGSGATFVVPVPGDYIIGIKYQTKTIAGAPAPVPADITYNFVSSLGASTAASVLLKKQ
jgi:hypothetical protein